MICEKCGRILCLKEIYNEKAIPIKKYYCIACDLDEAIFDLDFDINKIRS